MIRKIIAIIVGYFIFVVTSLALFKLSGQKPHEPATITFQVVAALYGTFFTMISGYLVPIIARTRTLTLNYILAAIIAGFALFSMFKTNGSHWTQLTAICLFAPASILGGYVATRLAKK